MMFPGWGMGRWMMASYGFVALLILVGIVVGLVAPSGLAPFPDRLTGTIAAAVSSGFAAACRIVVGMRSSTAAHLAQLSVIDAFLRGCPPLRRPDLRVALAIAI
jgi:hypothetical protein